MNKQEFLTILKQSLDGEIPDYEVENNIHYYETYLVDEKNKTLDEKLRELGEPRLIARTIIDAYLASKEGSFRKSTYSNYDYEEDYNEAKKEKSSQGNVKYYTWDTMKWYQKIIFIIIGEVKGFSPNSLNFKQIRSVVYEPDVRYCFYGCPGSHYPPGR